MSLTTETPRKALPGQQNATVAVYADMQHAEQAVRALEAAGYDMKQLSIVARTEPTKRHVIGFAERRHREESWAGAGALWGMLFGALFLVPGVGSVAVGGWLLLALATGTLGAGMGAIAAALDSIGVSEDGIARYDTAIKAGKQLVIAHGTAQEIDLARRVLADGDAETVQSYLAP